MRVIDRVAQRFPDQREAISRLYLRDERFRAICEDLNLAITSLHHFEARPDAPLRPEIDEFRAVLGELDDELLEYLATHDDARTRDGLR